MRREMNNFYVKQTNEIRQKYKGHSSNWKTLLNRDEQLTQKNLFIKYNLSSF